MTSLTDTQVVTASGGLVELGYFTPSWAGYLSVNQTAAASGNIVCEGSVVCDGSPILVEFAASNSTPSTTAGDHITFSLELDGSIESTYWGIKYAQSANYGYFPMYAQRRLTPSAGTHNFKVRAWVTNGSRPGQVFSQNGGSGNAAPAILRVSKIVQATQWPAVTTGTIICTSSTRPASPFEGQKIYETDTKKELTYNGASWTQPWNQPWGLIGIGTHDTGLQVAANTSFCSVTFTPVLNRYYQAFYTERTIWTTNGTIGIFDSVAGGRIAEQYGAPDPVTLQRTKTFSSTASRTLSILTDGVQTPISGSYSGNERPAQLVVTDVGPA